MNSINFSTVGGRHIASGMKCEDRSAVLDLNGVYAAAVSDGAGAKKYDYAADGAECIVTTITEFLCKNFDKIYENDDEEYLGKVIVSVCRKQLKLKSDVLGIDDIKRMSSTLLAVAVKDDKVIVCHLGDGVIGRLTPSGPEFITNPDNGEFAGTTYFVTSPGATEHIRVIKSNVGNTLSYFLMSDGTADFLVWADGNFAEAAEKMAMLVFNSDGQEQLELIMKNYMVEKDPASDDCSYACIGVHEMSTDDVEFENNDDSDDDISRHKAKSYKNGHIYKVLIVAVLVIIMLAIVFLSGDKKKTAHELYTVDESVSAEENSSVRY